MAMAEMDGRGRVMAEILVEVPMGLDGEGLAIAGEAIRAACGARARIPPAMPALRGQQRPAKSYSSSTGRKFMAAEGCELIRVEARLAHPCSGDGPQDVAAADALFAAALEALAGRRGLYGSSGIAAKELKGKMEARWWTPQCRVEMEALAIVEKAEREALAREGLGGGLGPEERVARGVGV